MTKYKWTEEQVREAVQNSTTYLGLARNLGIRQMNGNTSRMMKRRIEKLKIDVSHFVGQKVNVGSQPSNRKSANELLILRSSGMRRTHAHQLRRALLESGVSYVCAIDGQLPIWNDKPLTLHVDHVDGNWLDDRKENLRFLCPHCHSQTETYGYKG